MTLLARRLAYSFASLVFLILAPLVIAGTLGYRWHGWPPGLVQTGMLVISSQPRAEVWIDGRSRGLTPRRIAGLPPGVHTVRIERTGYGPWEQLVNVGPNTAHVLGPVKLFPKNFLITTLETDLQKILVDQDRERVIHLQNQAGLWELRPIWPTPTPTVTLETEPQELIESPHGQLWAITTPAGIVIRSPGKPEVAWELGAVTNLTWSQISEQVFFGLQDGQLVQFDALQKSAESLGSATSFAIANEILWFTRSALKQTELWRISSLGHQAPVFITSVDGQWELQPAPANQLWWRDRRTRAAEFLTYNALTTALGRESFGRVDRMFWNSNQPPMWMDGVDMVSWINNRAILLERTPDEVVALQWIEAPDIVLAIEPGRVSIRSVSARQGHHQIVNHELPDGQIFLVTAANPGRVLIFDQSTRSLRQLRWDQPAQ